LWLWVEPRLVLLNDFRGNTECPLRHLFATRCIENGVDIPTVSRWLGHQDGGARREKEAALIHERERSGCTRYVYIMEDPRNKSFKIGCSKTPFTRERTLQSEVPETILRFAIPADKEDERNLHDLFKRHRRRGEWFSLTADNLRWIIGFLKARGDAARMFVHADWSSRIAVHAPAKNKAE